MDALSDVLQLVRLGGAVYLHGEFTAPWSVAGRANAELCGTFLPPTERIISYHLVTAGSCWAQLPDEPDSAMEVRAGELLVVPQGEDHIMGSSLGLEPAPAGPMLSEHLKTAPGELLQLSYGGGGATTRLLCGFIACDLKPFNPLIDALPRLLHLPAEGVGAWVAPMLEHAASESGASRAGSAALLQRVSEMVFVDGARRYLDSLPPEANGWLGIFVPNGTPPAVIARLNAAIGKVMQSPEMKKQLLAQGVEARSTTPEQFNAFVKSEAAKWGKIIADANIKEQ